MPLTQDLDTVLSFLYKHRDTSHAHNMTLHTFKQQGIEIGEPLKILLDKLVKDGYCTVKQTSGRMPFDIYRISFEGIQFYENAAIYSKPYQSLEDLRLPAAKPAYHPKMVAPKITASVIIKSTLKWCYTHPIPTGIIGTVIGGLILWLIIGS